MEATEILKKFLEAPIRVFSKDIQEIMCDAPRRRDFLSRLDGEERGRYQDNALRLNLIAGPMSILAHSNVFNIFVPSNLEEIFSGLWKRLSSYQSLTLNEKIDYVREVKGVIRKTLNQK